MSLDQWTYFLLYDMFVMIAMMMGAAKVMPGPGLSRQRRLLDIATFVGAHFSQGHYTVITASHVLPP